MKIYIPKVIQPIVGEEPYTLDQMGMSGSEILCIKKSVLKITEKNDVSDREIEMLLWLQHRLPVPKVIVSLSETNKNYLLMEKMPGKMACDESYLNQPELLIELLTKGLKRLWQVDIQDCPCQDLLDLKLQQAKTNLNLSICDTDHVEPNTYGPNGFSSPQALYEWLVEHRPQITHPVFSHGDYCLPNVFFLNHDLNGFIDVGGSGVTDMYQDIALCYRSLIHNYDGHYGYQGKVDFNPNLLFEKLGLEPDWEKIKYFTLLDELF